MTSKENNFNNADGVEDVNGVRVDGKQSSDEERPLQSYNRIRRDSLAKIEIQAHPPEKEAAKKPLRTYDTVMSNLNIAKKTRLPFLVTVILCVILLIVIIVLVSFWPQVPYYMKAEICVDKECIDSSKQILTWANTSVNVCNEPYKFTCGNFINEYEEQNINKLYKGEWNVESYQDYEEIRELHSFISMLPNDELSYSSASILKSLYKSCREIETMDKSQADTLLKKIIKSLDGWRALRDGKGLQVWDYRKSLIYAQSVYGAFPFFKISVTRRAQPPYGNIIFLEEGEIGLPHKIFYNLENDNKITNAYKMLLRDFALNMGVVGEESEQFADEMFHYERRIVNQIILTERSSDNDINQIKKVGQLKKLAPSLPIFETIQAIFSKTKITEETEVLVQNYNILQAMSIIISTTDKQPLNDFIIWSVVRQFLPYLSREYNVLVEKYEQELYGSKAVIPKWFFCTEVIRNMMSFAIDTLQENSTHSTANSVMTANQDYNSNLKLVLGDELFKLLFYHIRNEVQLYLEKATGLDETNRSYIMEKLNGIKLQIGLPDEALNSTAYVSKYYEDFLLQNLFFAEHLESFWSFKKTQLEKSLKPLRLIDLIIAELYSSKKPKRIAFSPNMNLAIITRRNLRLSRFDYKYPIAMNFARLGTDITEFLLDVVTFYLPVEKQNSTFPLNGFLDLKCLEREIIDYNKTLPQETTIRLYNQVIASEITFSAFKSFINAIANNEYILKAPIPGVTYEDLGLTNRKRQPGLRYLEEQQYFTISLLQNHCSVSDELSRQFKPFIRNQVPQSQTFYTLWNHVPYLSKSLYCSTTRKKCFNVF